MTSVIEQLKIDEGFRGKPYEDTVGKVTVGYGRNLDDNPLTEEEAEYLLKHDIEKCEQDAATISYYSELDYERKQVILNMLYNMGLPSFNTFVNFNRAMSEKNYDLASIEMLDSKWAHQVGDRAIRLSNIIKNG